MFCVNKVNTGDGDCGKGVAAVIAPQGGNGEPPTPGRVPYGVAAKCTC